MNTPKLSCYLALCLGFSATALAVPVMSFSLTTLASSSVMTNVSVGVGFGNNDYRDPWRWNVGVSNSWYGYPYRNGYYRPGWRPGYNWGVGSRWRYPYSYSNRYYSPYRYDRQTYKAPKPKVVRPPERVTTSVSYSTGLNRLPDNARVIQRDGRTIYEWQGVEYIFDWQTNTYQKIN